MRIGAYFFIATAGHFFASALLRPAGRRLFGASSGKVTGKAGQFLFLFAVKQAAHLTT
jgi:hypothetical protein